MTGNESQRRHTVISSFNEAVDPKTDTNPNGVKIANISLEYESKPIIYVVLQCLLFFLFYFFFYSV